MMVHAIIAAVDPASIQQVEFEAALATIRIGMSLLGLLVSAVLALLLFIWRSQTARIEEVGDNVRSGNATMSAHLIEFAVVKTQLSAAQGAIEKQGELLEQIRPMR